MSKSNLNKLKRTLISACSAILLLVAGHFSLTSVNPPTAPAGTIRQSIAPHQTIEAQVARTVDGDTCIIRIQNQTYRLRLIGIDTPESVHPDPKRNTKAGKQASLYTQKALTGKTVRVEFDQRITDRYDRLLGYLWLDDKLFNQTLVAEGLAQAKSYPPNRKYDRLFKTAEQLAKQSKKGIWKTD